MTLAEIARRKNVNYSSLQRRVNIEGQSVEEAIRNIRSYKERAKWLQVAKDNGIGEGAYRRRLMRGWSREKAATEPVPDHFRAAGWAGWKGANQSRGVTP